jgi:hypothetical protein
MKPFACLLVVVGLLIHVPRALAVSLVDKGQPRAIIIVPEKPAPLALAAARMFRDHILQMM